jgi:predicted nucleic acid-binding Zn ribbon protein
MQRITDDPVASCQTCEAPVERVFHPVAVHFKGSGFYATDYGSRKRRREEGDGGDGGSSESSEKKSDPSKSEASKSEPGSHKVQNKAAA